MRPLLLRAPWAFPVDTPPIRDAAVLIGGDGRIAAVGPRAAVPSPEEAKRLDLGDAMLLPGLVNTHTHLELTGFPETAAGSDFPAWILSIRRLKQGRSPTEFLEAARAGLRECWAGGVTTIADTGDSGAALRALAELGGSGIAYQEVFGPHPEQVEESVGGLVRRVEDLAGLAGERVRLGLSPHAPYTVSGPLFARVAAWAGRERLPLAVHVAESAAETEFVTRGRGPFADAWKARGIPLLHDLTQQPRRPTAAPPHRHPAAPPHCHTPVSWLQSLGVLGSHTLCIHAIRLTEGDVARLQRSGAAVAHCPVSNARHGHGAAPLGALRRAGIRVGIGTDSVASVGRLDLLVELRAARDLAGLSDEEALALATIEGARALGLEREIGTLTVGKWGDVIAIRPPDPASSPLDCRTTDVLLTVIGGRIVYSTA